MSYDKLKYMSIKNHEIFLTTACNNLRPLNYEKWEFCPSCTDLTEKLELLGKDIFDGNIQPIPSCNNNLYELSNEMHGEYRKMRVDFDSMDICYPEIREIMADAFVKAIYTKDTIQNTINRKDIESLKHNYEAYASLLPEIRSAIDTAEKEGFEKDVDYVIRSYGNTYYEEGEPILGFSLEEVEHNEKQIQNILLVDYESNILTGDSWECKQLDSNKIEKSLRNILFDTPDGQAVLKREYDEIQCAKEEEKHLEREER